MPPNPFHDAFIPIVAVMHAQGGHAGKPELCPICHPEIIEIVPSWWPN